jgi:16S rRNA (adenine1518-N6/adenine1519-N6)-dimethyltransferase
MYRKTRKVKKTSPRVPGFRAQKGLGQNFLTDESAARKMVSLIAPQADELLLEIGPGQGALTRILLETGARVHGVEYDEQLARYLVEHLGQTGSFTVSCQDILGFDLVEYIQEQGLTGIRVVGNLPYLISHRILQWLVRRVNIIPEAYITLQKEVGMRLTAKPNTKEYGPVTITTGCFYRTEKKMALPATSFRPRPKVDSVFLKLERSGTDEHRIAEPSLFFSLVRQSFGHRRKMLKNNLTGWQLATGPLDAGTVKNLEEKSGISFSRRAESLTRQEFITLSNVIHEHQQITP